jgi:hypothetical protein
MLTIVLLCLGLTADEPAGPADKAPADLAAYRAAAAQAGKDAGAQVRLALWCESHGMTAERMKHLAAAVLNDPSSVLARGLMGMVARGGKWARPEEVSRAVRDEPRLKALFEEYLQRRAKAADKADDQWKLATWCDQNGLKEQAAAHWHAVVRLDPRRDAAWVHLGFKKVGGRWVKPEWQAAAKREADEQERANKHWRPILERLRSGLGSRDKHRRESAESELAEMTDPRAVPMVWAVLVTRGAEWHRVAVRVLGQIDSPGSSRALTLLALSSKSPEARGQAVQSLRQRDPRDFAPMLVALIRDPVKYEVKKVAGPGNPGELVIEDGTTKRKRLYSPPAAPQPSMGLNDYLSLDAQGLPVITRYLGAYDVSIGPARPWMGAAFGPPNPSPAQVARTLEKAGISPGLSQKLGTTLGSNGGGQIPILGNPKNANMAEVTISQELRIPIGQMMLESEMAARVAAAQLAGDLEAITAYSDAVRDTNRQARQVLAGVIGNDLGDDRSAWSRWLVDLFGFAYAPQKSSSEKDTVIEQVPLSYQPQTAPVYSERVASVFLFFHSCFGAGTPVRTLDGVRPIESLRAGDLVLTQNPDSGELAYQAIVAVYHNPLNATHCITLDDGSSVVATGIHRLWKTGKGWTMVRELKPGDVLRTLGSVASVKSVEAEKTQPVYNLQVADGESYFVGSTGVLAHDNSTINPVPEPFDAVGPLPAASSPGRPRSMLGR